ncbi:MAG: CarD family transcriptional regulator [Lachnospiraceae bacterium]|nr:CarD family transcriptional regulator [Lachnospiraceae bacterium]
MYQIGDYIVHEGIGVCEVTDICEMALSGKGTERTYYVLVPYGDKGGRTFTPVDSDKIRMRPVMSRQEINELVGTIPSVDCIQENNDKLRAVKYKEALGAFEAGKLLEIIKTVYLGKQRRIRSGKKVLSGDEKYFQIAEKKLYDEIAFVFSEDTDQVKRWITDEIKKCS